jgi:hypothetical protein
VTPGMFALPDAPADNRLAGAPFTFLLNHEMNVHHAVAIVGRDHSLVLQELPFPEGQAVEVTIVPKAQPKVEPKYPLRGSVKRFEHPTDPIVDDEWEANK